MENHLEKQRKVNLKKLVSNARAIVTYQIGIPFGCRRMNGILFRLKSLNYPVFEEYRAATQELPTGSERLRWDRKILKQKDIELEAINKKFRETIFDACYEIIDSYSNSES
ncbi:MAG TPA: hypothetical protein VHG71_08830 [Verrucomicrobiae bacterium]|nr:hypothetical protein [Verrucomicrobiae bacterium]